MPNAAATAVSKAFIAFGNLTYAMLGDRQAMEFATSEHFAFNKLQTYLRFAERIAIKIAQPKAFSKLVTAAS